MVAILAKQETMIYTSSACRDTLLALGRASTGVDCDLHFEHQRR